MYKAAARHGDPTTTGGYVIACSSSIYDHNKRVALSGDMATCGNCEGAHRIIGTCSRAFEKGRNVVLDGDLVACPCGKNRIMVGSNPRMLFEITRDSAARASVDSFQSAQGAALKEHPDLPVDVKPVAASSMAYMTAQRFDEQVQVAGVAGLAGYPYFIEAPDGKTLFGRVDDFGRLPRIYTELTERYIIYWGEDALEKQAGA